MGKFTPVLVYFLVALIPLIVGGLWYSPFLFAKPWMKLNGFTEESLRGTNMAVVFGLTYVFGLFLTYVLTQLAIHQTGVLGVLASDPEFGTPGSASALYYEDFISRYGDRHRSFGHGLLHGGLIAGIGFALPVIGVLALFERRGWRYIALHTGYWVVTLALMGGFVGAFVEV